VKSARSITKRNAGERSQREKMMKRFPFVACIKRGGKKSDAKLAESYLYGEGEERQKKQ
jgi:hypothetical protein